MRKREKNNSREGILQVIGQGYVDHAYPWNRYVSEA